MLSTTVVVLNEEGLHARPAGVLVKTANTFNSEIELSVNGDSANAKSIMSIMGLGLTKDTVVTVSADGSDAQEALDQIANLFKNKFHL